MPSGTDAIVEIVTTTTDYKSIQLQLWALGLAQNLIRARLETHLCRLAGHPSRRRPYKQLASNANNDAPQTIHAM